MYFIQFHQYEGASNLPVWYVINVIILYTAYACGVAMVNYCTRLKICNILPQYKCNV